MCDPITIAIVAGTTMLAGTAAQRIGQSRSESAARNAYALQASRQDDLANQSRAIFQNSVEKMSPETVKAEMEKAAAERRAAYEKSVGDTPVAVPTQATTGAAPRILNNASRAESVSRDNYVSGLADALARLNAHGDAMQTAGIEINKNRLSQGVVADASKGWANLLPIELQAAQQKGAGAKMIGDLLVGAGQIGLGYAGGLGGAAGSSAANIITGAGKSITGLSNPPRGPGI